MAQSRTLRSLVALALVAVLGACGGEEEAGPTGVEFGRGTLPVTVPEDFPVPEVAVINSTLIDWDNDRTEVSMIFPAGVPIVAQFFDEILPSRGYVVESSTGAEDQWTLAFSKDGLDGDIALRAQTETTTVVTLELRE